MKDEPAAPVSETPEWLRIPGARLAWRAIEAVAKPQPIALAIGMFDGVHLGHQSVIESAVTTARRARGIAAALTFTPHPSRLFRPSEPTLLLQPPALKAREILRRGVDLVITRTFDQAFAQLDAGAFLRYLREVLPSVSSIHVGENFRYGRGRTGDVSQLLEDARSLGIDVFSVDRFRYNGEPVSSSRLRMALAAGEIAAVNSLLGYHYYAEGPVVAGRRIGRTIGFPTLNLEWDPELRPRLGVYAVRVTGPDGRTVPGVANYGLRPTVEEAAVHPLLEVHLLRETQWTVGVPLRVSWHQFLRPEKKFPDFETLKRQIAADREAAERYFRDQERP